MRAPTAETRASVPPKSELTNAVSLSPSVLQPRARPAQIWAYGIRSHRYSNILKNIRIAGWVRAGGFESESRRDPLLSRGGRPRWDLTGCPYTRRTPRQRRPAFAAFTAHHLGLNPPGVAIRRRSAHTRRRVNRTHARRSSSGGHRCGAAAAIPIFLRTRDGRTRRRALR